MKFKRDTAWLSQKIMTPALKKFYLAENDLVGQTLREELALLFPKIEATNDVTEANLVFEIKEDTQQLLGEEGFEINSTKEDCFHLTAGTTRGLLYGFFNLYEYLLTGEERNFPYISIPAQAMRMINQWDNADASVERGYAGDSIFYTNHDFRRDYQLIREYARLLASVGLNSISINNVNVHEVETKFITPEYLNDVEKVAFEFRRYGIKTFLSINYAAPVEIGGLSTADPFDSAVKNWWSQTAKNIYQVIPDFGGFVVKADSENRPGPFTYNRNHDDGANILGDALAPFGGVVVWRCFVYDCAQDWRDRSIDRARAAYDNFMKLDGNFRDNVILQIKNGPIDFQVREPISPLFGSLEKTNQILEFQIAQEYTGQQKHVCYLLPMWKEVLEFETHSRQEASQVKQVIKTQSPNSDHSGIAAVSNIGFDYNWTGHKLAQANLYGYGKIVWNNELSSEKIALDWLKLTFQLAETAYANLLDLLMSSRKTYENYTAPMGIGFMVEPNHHYGPNIDGYEYSRWGTYHFADRNGVGVDRTQATGTGYIGQYLGSNQELYENIDTCPDNLLLFFHHVSYEHVLQNGKTVMQHIYDTHFEGVKQVEKYQELWASLEGEIESTAFENVSERLSEQMRCSLEWRDQINTYFYRKSGIADDLGRKIY